MRGLVNHGYANELVDELQPRHRSEEAQPCIVLITELTRRTRPRATDEDGSIPKL